jgi:hypothetical protein
MNVTVTSDMKIEKMDGFPVDGLSFFIICLFSNGWVDYFSRSSSDPRRLDRALKGDLSFIAEVRNAHNVRNCPLLY